MGTQSERRSDPTIGHQHKVNRYCRLAGLIWRLKQAIDQHEAEDNATREAGHDTARDDFRSAANITRFSLVKIDVESLIFPALGPHEDYDESFMEPYNRVYYLYSFLCYNSTSSRWRYLLQLSEKDLDDKREISEGYIPYFMREKAAEEQETNKLEAQEHQRLIKIYKKD